MAMFSLSMGAESSIPEKSEYDAIVIGAGPAGSSAAIYIKRNGYDVAIIEGGTIGGQLSTSTEIENYLGIPKMTGMEWSEYTKKHLDHLKIPVIVDTVTEVVKSENGYVVKTSSGRQLRTKAVVFATGADHRHLNALGEDKYEGKGVSYCATCDGYFFKGKDVAVIGGGNTAFEYASFLSGVANRVYLIHRRDQFRAEKVMVDRVKSLPNVEFLLGYVIDAFEGDDTLKRIKLKHRETGEIKTVEVEGAFVAIGTVPNSSVAKALGVETDDHGFIKVDDRMHTNLPGVYACGDVTGRGTAQAINAAAQGMTAGLECSNYLQSLKS